MAQTKQYGAAEDYERKLARVMERLGVSQFDHNWDRHGAWIQFTYKGEVYRFDHTVARAKAAGINLRYGSDAFAQLVLTLEDLARMIERGIYDLQSWVAGMKYLPEPKPRPWFLTAMGFSSQPGTEGEIKDRYRTLAKDAHPDGGGTAERFHQLTQAYEATLAWFREGKPT